MSAADAEGAATTRSPYSRGGVDGRSRVRPRRGRRSDRPFPKTRAASWTHTEPPAVALRGTPLRVPQRHMLLRLSARGGALTRAPALSLARAACPLAINQRRALCSPPIERKSYADRQEEELRRQEMEFDQFFWSGSGAALLSPSCDRRSRRLPRLISRPGPTATTCQPTWMRMR